MLEPKKEKYVSCKWLESGVCFDNGVYGSNIKLCCYMSAPGGGNAMIYEGYKGEKINWDDFFRIKSCSKKWQNCSTMRGMCFFRRKRVGSRKLY